MIRNFMLGDIDNGTSSPKTAVGNIATIRSPDEKELAVEFTSDEDVLGKDIVDATTKKEDVKEDKKVVEKKVEFTAKVAVPADKKEIKQSAKVEPKEDVKPVVTPKGPQLISPLAAQKATPQQRDFTGFTEEETRHLKAMSNEAFEYTTKLIKEAKELNKAARELKGAQFVQHPKAYVLDPQYEELQTNVTFLQKEADYWQSQLIQAVEGRDWRPITGWDKQGNPVLGAPQKATALATEQLRLAVSNCMNGAHNGNQQLQQFTQNYQQRISQDNQVVQQICAQHFGWCADPKQLDMTVNTGEKEETVRDIRERFTQLFPPYHRNTIGIEVAAHMFAALQIYGQRIRELENGKHVAEVKAEEVLRAEPLGNRSAEELKAVNGITEFDMEGLPV